MAEWTLPEAFASPAGTVRWAAWGQGEPLVLMHGTPFWSYEWHRIAPLLARHHRVYVYDMPGYGRSTMHAGQDVSLSMQSTVFAALVAHWGLASPGVVAHDFGGATALRAHLLHGVDYARLLLIDPVAIRPWGSPFVQHVRQHEAAFAGVPDYLQHAIVTAYLRTAMHRALPEAELEPYVQPWLGEPGQAALYRQIAQMDPRFTDEIEPLLGQVRCPVSLLWGEADAWIPPAQGERLRAALGTSRYRTVPDAGHLMQEDAPEAIVAEAQAFFGMGG